FEGNRSDLLHALDQVGERFSHRPLAGILVFSDGLATDREEWEGWTGEIPVYPVLPEIFPTVDDLAITGVGVAQTNFESAPVNLRANLVARREAGRGGDEGKGFAVRVTSVGSAEGEEPKVWAEEQLVLSEAKGIEEVVTLPLLGTPPGISFFQVTVEGEGEETTLENNEWTVAVDRGQGPYRVLYVSGRPNWEYKYLRRALQMDDEVSVVGLLRVAKREPKFVWRGRRGETSNPLFRGFQQTLEEEEPGHDQPVLIRMNTEDAEELRGGFPREKEELFSRYDAVILDDLEVDFFTEDQQSLLEEFVSRRGGSLLMLGGQESLQWGNYGRTTLGQMLPVSLTDGKPVATGAKWSLTREGWFESWMRLRKTREEEESVLVHVPEFRTVHGLDRPKPGARVLTEVTDEEGREAASAFSFHAYGDGRVATLAVGDLWRWGMEDGIMREDMERWWRQVTRWLVADVPDFVEVTSAWEDERQGQRKIQVRVKDEGYRPDENASVEVTWEKDSGETGALVAQPSLEEPGLFEASFPMPSAGGYRVKAVVTRGEASGEDAELQGPDEEVEILEGETGWAWNPAREELAELSGDVALLEELANRTGGEVVALADLGEWTKTLPQKKAPVQEMRITPLWHQAWIFVVICALLAAEWGLRRWGGKR
ncbi:MAG: hypothetical protein AAGJ31_06115, partial [Verrucomicrobiota bacterium]